MKTDIMKNRVFATAAIIVILEGAMGSAEKRSDEEQKKGRKKTI